MHDLGNHVPMCALIEEKGHCMIWYSSKETLETKAYTPLILKPMLLSRKSRQKATPLLNLTSWRWHMAAVSSFLFGTTPYECNAIKREERGSHIDDILIVLTSRLSSCWMRLSAYKPLEGIMRWMRGEDTTGGIFTQKLHKKMTNRFTLLLAALFL